MKNLLNLRIFWTCELNLGADGYYYYYWDNWINNNHEIVFAGYTKSGICSKISSWDAVKRRL